MALSSRASVAALALVAVAAIGASVMPPDLVETWWLRIAGAGFLVTLLPGMLTVLAWRPRDAFTLLELLGFGFGVSFAVVQVVTIVAVMYAWSVDHSIAVLAGWVIVHAIIAVRRGADGAVVRSSWAELGFLFVILLLGALLYIAGSPVDSTEPRIHVALVRRLVHLSSPTFYTMYFAPDVVYPYPFPGTHYMLALMSRMEGIDPLFLYVKTRAIWGVAAPVLVYGCAQAIFHSHRIAMATAVVAVGFVANGTFGGVPEFSWAQLAPYSHASDVAMGVLLPALLLLAFQFLASSSVRERWFFLAATLGLSLMLVMVHPREIVQFLVYFTVFTAVCLLLRQSRSMAMRALTLVVLVAVALVVYRGWHELAVPATGVMVQDEREGVGRFFAGTSWGDLFGPPVPLLRNYVVAFGMFFYGWTPVVLLASPFVLFLLRRRPLVLLLAASIVCYLLIVRFPILGLPYIYLTYFEILYTPVRNVIFFVHLLAGVACYLMAARLARHRLIVSVPAALALAAVLTGSFRSLGPYLNDRPEMADWLFAPILVAYAILGRLMWNRRDAPPGDGWIDTPHPRWVVVMAALCVPVIVTTELPESSLRRVAAVAAPRTPDALFRSLPCLKEGQYCPPPRGLIRLAEREVPVESVFAVDMNDEYQPSLFMPQRMVAWPGEAQGLIPRVVFARFYQRFDRSVEAYGEQPFFNDRETPAERLSFVRDFGVTHIMLNPRVHDLMSGVLARFPDVFVVRYDDGLWALYEVAAKYRGLNL